MLIWPFLGGGLAAWGLKPWRANHVAGKLRWGVTAALLVVAVVGWLITGFSFVPLAH